MKFMPPREFVGFGEYIGNPFSICFEKRLITVALIVPERIISSGIRGAAKLRCDRQVQMS
jgi:hypothetical protein